MTQSTMSDISRSRDTKRLVSLRNWRGKRLRQNIETIVTLTEKEHCLGSEILNIKHKCEKFKIDIIITTKFLNKK
jgi:hypothetical protein